MKEEEIKELFKKIGLTELYIPYVVSAKFTDGILEVILKEDTPRGIFTFFDYLETDKITATMVYGEKFRERLLKDLKEQEQIMQGETNKGYNFLTLGISRYITPQVRYKVLKRQHWRCAICGAKLKYKKNSPWEGEVAHIDHIHPYAERFTYPKGAEFINEIDNLQALCPACNRKKWRHKI